MRQRVGDAGAPARDYHAAVVRRIERQRVRLALQYFGARAVLAAKYWGVQLGDGGQYYGPILFHRVDHSVIATGSSCVFRSAHWSNQVGLNRPCMLSTLEAGAEVSIGDGCGLSGTVIAAVESVTLGRGVLCGANVTITDTDWHVPEAPHDSSRIAPHSPVRIEDGVWLGLNAVVLKGVTIGHNSVVGAGSVVVESVPPRVVVAGQPAKILREL